MAWIETVADDQAEGTLRKIYDDANKRVGFVAQILRVSSLNPGALRGYMGMYRAIMFDESPLSRAQREMLATITAKTSHCVY